MKNFESLLKEQIAEVMQDIQIAKKKHRSNLTSSKPQSQATTITDDAETKTLPSQMISAARTTTPRAMSVQSLSQATKTMPIAMSSQPLTNTTASNRVADSRDNYETPESATDTIEYNYDTPESLINDNELLAPYKLVSTTLASPASPASQLPSSKYATKYDSNYASNYDANDNNNITEMLLTYEQVTSLTNNNNRNHNSLILSTMHILIQIKRRNSSHPL